MASDTRDRILQATSELMRRNGYAGTSLKDISAAAQATFSSLYFHFPGGKEQMAAEAVAMAARRFLDHLDSELPHAATFEEIARRYFAPSIRALESSDFQAGCPVGTPANDAPTSADSLKTACQRALSSFASVVARELRRLGYAGPQAEAAATLIVSANQGAILLARTAKNRSPIETALHALTALGAALAMPPQP
jgi:TetR/AcrR family transcriptional repressor of lmrAB and yxaGH operons